MRLSRRDILAYGSMLGLPGAVLDAAEALAQTGAVRTRENITTFATDGNKVAALRAAVNKMKTRSSTDENDPLGWYYWSAVHGTDKPVPSDLTNIYRKCDHTQFQPIGPPTYIAQHFISWHRAFLFFFEATLKAAAKEAGITTALELPYWNWYVDGALPTIFTEGNQNTNPLWHPRVNNAVNSGALQRAFFSQKDLLPDSPGNYQKSFSVPLERNPHGAIHGTIGGDMGFVPRSARDPIFWLHHANIDRLWTAWINMGDGRKNPPSNSAWAKQEWTFDKAGQMKQSAGAVTDSEKTLGYRYDNYAPPAQMPPAGPAPLGPTPFAMAQAPKVVLEGTPAQASGGAVTHMSTTVASSTTVSSSTSLSLGNQSVAVDMKLAPAAQNQLQMFAASSAPTEVTGAWLVLEDVQISPAGQQGGFSFSVKATLPDGSGFREIPLAELNTFNWPAAAGTAHDHGAHGPVTLTIPLKDVLQDLNVKNPADLTKGLRVVFEAVHPEKPDAANAEFVKIGAIRVKTSNAPIK